MAEIAQRVFAVDGTKNLLRLYNEEFVRPVNIPATYGRLRLALSLAIADTGGNITLPNTFFAGFCSSPSTPFTDVTCARADGFYVAASTVLSRNAGGGNPYYLVGGGAGARRNLGVLNTSVITTTGFCLAATTGVLQRRSWLVMDVVQSSTFLNIAMSTSAGISADTTPTNFVEVAETLPPGYLGNAYALQAASPGGSVASPLTTVNIFWSAGVAPLEIYAMAVYVYLY